MSALETRLDLMTAHGLRLGESDLFESRNQGLYRRKGVVEKRPNRAGSHTYAYTKAFRRKAVAAGRKALEGVARGGREKALRSAAAALGVAWSTLRDWIREAMP